MPILIHSRFLHTTFPRVEPIRRVQLRFRDSHQRRSVFFTIGTACLIARITCFSIQRQIRSNALLTVSYVGNEGHHILVLVPTNTGNPALCLSLNKQSQVALGEVDLRAFRRGCRLHVGLGAGLPRNPCGPGVELRGGDRSEDDWQFGFQRPGG